jgi:Cft2 family RNA processing exonuclease
MSEQSATLRLISGVNVKGPACFLLETGGKRLMLDLGEGPPPGLLPDVGDVGRIDALVLSHGHKDHIGGISLLPKLGNPPVYATEIVARDLPNGLDLRPLPIAGPSEVLGIGVETGRNGHAPGGVWLRFAAGVGLLYTGDVSAESILYAYDPPPAAGTALFDCSYASYDKALGDCWSNLAPHVVRGPLLLPVPANGRGPEIALMLARQGLKDIFVDDAMRQALARLADGAAVSLRAGIGDEVKRLAEAVRPIGEPQGVMLAASADGTSGATARLFDQWETAKQPGIVFTGYVPSGTPAARMIESGRAQFVRWNVHPRRTDIITTVRTIGAKTVIPAFCDRSQLDALKAALEPASVTMDGPITL